MDEPTNLDKTKTCRNRFLINRDRVWLNFTFSFLSRSFESFIAQNNNLIPFRPSPTVASQAHKTPSIVRNRWILSRPFVMANHVKLNQYSPMKSTVKTKTQSMQKVIPNEKIIRGEKILLIWEDTSDSFKWISESFCNAFISIWSDLWKMFLLNS